MIKLIDVMLYFRKNMIHIDFLAGNHACLGGTISYGDTEGLEGEV